MDRQTTLNQLDEILPLAAQWVAEQQQRALCEGVPLSKEELRDAKAIGVQHPERVRLLQVQSVPVPGHPVLREAAASINFLTLAPRGLSLGYAIFIRSDCWGDRELIAHELAHTAQYQRLGGVIPFLQSYIYQCATVGYANAPLEQEAKTAVARIA